MTNKLTLTLEYQPSLKEKMWVATFTGPHSVQAIELFSTNKLLTPFSDKTTPEHVLETIKALHDIDCEIVIG